MDNIYSFDHLLLSNNPIYRNRHYISYNRASIRIWLVFWWDRKIKCNGVHLYTYSLLNISERDKIFLHFKFSWSNCIRYDKVYTREKNYRTPLKAKTKKLTPNLRCISCICPFWILTSIIYRSKCRGIILIFPLKTRGNYFDTKK